MRWHSMYAGDPGVHVSSMGSSKSVRVPRYPRDRFAHLGVGGDGITNHLWQRRELGSKVQQVPHREYYTVPLCMRPPLEFL